MLMIASIATMSAGQVYIQEDEGISQPTSGSTIEGDSTFPFTFIQDNRCSQGYSPFNIYLLPGPDAPTASSLNGTQQFSEEDYLAFLGYYLVPNFGTLLNSDVHRQCCYSDLYSTGLQNLPPGPPPSALTTPVLDLSYVGTTVYVAVVQTQTDCDVCVLFVLRCIALTYTQL